MTTFDQPTIDFDAAPASAHFGSSSTGTNPPKGYHYESGRCPNVGSACFCPGTCRPKLVKDEVVDLDEVSQPITGETLATVQLIADDRWADDDWAAFWDACHECAGRYGDVVDPNVVRGYLSNAWGLTIGPKRYASFWSKATSKAGFLDNIPGPDGWTTNTDTAGGNAGKPIRLRRLRKSP